MNKTMIYCLSIVLMCVACSDDDGGTPANVLDQSRISFTEPSNSGGCVNFQIYHYSDNQEYGLLLSSDADQINLTTDWQSFDFGPNQGDVVLALYEFSQPVSSFFCDDVVEAKEDPIQEWMAIEGSVRLRVAQERNDVGIYAIDVVITDVVVNGITIDRLELNSVSVGFQPG